MLFRHWFALSILLAYWSCGFAQAVNGRLQEEYDAFFREIATGKAEAAVHRLPALKKLGSAEVPAMQVDLWASVFDACADVSSYECLGEAFSELSAALKSQFSVVKGDKEKVRAVLAIMTEKALRHSMAFNLDIQKGEDRFKPEQLEEFLFAPIAGCPFAACNLTLSEAFLREGQLDKARFYLRRGWVSFLTPASPSAPTVASLLPRFIRQFFATGQASRGIQFSLISRTALERIGNVHAYNGIDSIGAIAQLDLLLGNVPASIEAQRVIRQTTLGVEMDSDLRNGIRAAMAAEILGLCALSAPESCPDRPDLIGEVSRVLSLVLDNGDRGPYSQNLALALVLDAMRHSAPVPDVAARALEKEPAQSAGLSNPEAPVRFLAGKAFIAAVRRDANRTELLLEAAKAELARIRRFQEIQPADVAPIHPYSRVLLGWTAQSLLDRGVTERRDQELLLEIAFALNRGPRTIESEFLWLRAKAGLDYEASFTALHRLEERMFAEEKEALRRLLDAFTNYSEAKLEAIGKQAGSSWVSFNLLQAEAANHERTRRDVATRTSPNEGMLASLQRVLRPGEVSVTHFATPDRHVRICVSDHGYLAESTDRTPAEEIVTLKILRAALTNPGPADPASDAKFPLEAAKKVSAWVLGTGACIGTAEHIILATDAAISSVPPHILLDPAAKVPTTDSIARIPWLGLSRGVSVVADARQFMALRELGDAVKPTLAFLGVGDPSLGGLDENGQPRVQAITRGLSRKRGSALTALEELPDTRKELEHFARVFGEKSRLLLSDSASEDSLRSLLLDEFEVVSFATHGLVREEVEGLQEAALLLTPKNSSVPSDDGLLTASEIAQLQFRAKLVVLSACNSANFDLQLFGPEAAALSSAFFLAGAKGTIASLWSVDSERTAELMHGFGTLLAGRKTAPALALRDAMHQLVERHAGTAFAHPRFWASFVVHGDGGLRLEAALPGTELQMISVDDAGGGASEWDRVLFSGRKVLTVGHKHAPGAKRLAGVIRSYRPDGLKEYELVKADESFIAAGIGPDGNLVTTAWRLEADRGLQLWLRKYSPQLEQRFDKPVHVAKDELLYSALLKGDRLYLAFGRRGRASTPFAVRVVRLTLEGDVEAEYKTDVRTDLSPHKVSLLNSSDGLWLSITGSDFLTKKNVTLPYGVEFPCTARYKTDFVQLAADTLTERRKWERKLNIALNDSLPLGNGRDAVAFTEYADCLPNSSVAGVAIFEDGVEKPFRVPYRGIATESGALRESADGSFLLIGKARRNLALDVPYDEEKSFSMELDSLRQRQRPDRQTALYIAKYSRDGVFLADRNFFNGSQFWATDVDVHGNQALLVGANNFKAYIGRLDLGSVQLPGRIPIAQ